MFRVVFTSVPVPPFQPETEEEEQEYAAALARRKIRLQR